MYQDLNIERTEITFGLDSVVVRKFTNGVLGGVTLDVTNYQLSNVVAGQVVITDGNGTYRPMPVSGDQYGEMPEGFRFFGIVYRSSRVKQGVSVMTRGAVNKYRMPYNWVAIQDAFVAAVDYMIIPACDVEEMDEYERLETSDGVVYTSDGQEIWFRRV